MKKSLLILICLFSLLSCSKKPAKKTIILSKASSNYIKWIEDDNVIILDAYTIDNIDSILCLADAIILTGGEDINPLQYNDTLNLQVCETINFFRDTLERKLFDYAMKNKIPLVGICRGMQMMNVASGGTLYGDIPTEIGTEVMHRDNGEVMHDVVVTCHNLDYTSMVFPQKSPPGTHCWTVTDTLFTVNSWHHQGLKDVADDLNVIARSYDGLPEAVIMDQDVHPFMIGVQFHPERLGKDNGISNTIKTNLLHKIYQTKIY